MTTLRSVRKWAVTVNLRGDWLLYLIQESNVAVR